jgi:hypothetical protein
MREFVTIPLVDLYRTAERRPAGYVDYVLRHAVSLTAVDYTLEQYAYQSLCIEFGKGRVSMPLHDANSLFRSLWARLHAHRAGSDALVFSVLGDLPCGDCREKSRGYLLKHPPIYGPGWFGYTVDWHDDVNREQGKPPLGLVAATALWAPARQVRTIV